MQQLIELVYQLSEQLKAHKLSLTTAESCTGGLIAGLLTELPGSSVWFERGFVTYSNESKIEMLGVNPQLIDEFGAVSQQVAEAMALGALTQSKADLALAVTGIAGPSGGSTHKPVGTVWFAWAGTNYPLRSQCLHFDGASRSGVRQLACKHAIEGIGLYFQR